MKTSAALSLAAVAGLALTAGASAQTFGGAGFNIPDNNPAGASSNAVSNVAQAIQSISVNLTFGGTGGGASGEHTWVGDLIATLSYNDGVNPVATAFIMNRVGKTLVASGFGRADDMNGSYDFNDAATLSLWTNAAVSGNIPNGAYRATSNAFTGVLATSETLVSLDSIFGGLGGSGTWTLSISDNAGGDSGGLASWSVTITPVPAPGAFALLGLGGLVAARRRRA